MDKPQTPSAVTGGYQWTLIIPLTVTNPTVYLQREREREKHSVILLKLLQSNSVLKKKEETLFKVTDYVVDTRSKAVAG